MNGEHWYVYSGNVAHMWMLSKSALSNKSLCGVLGYGDMLNEAQFDSGHRKCKTCHRIIDKADSILFETVPVPAFESEPENRVETLQDRVDAMPDKANNYQIGGSHYKGTAIEPWDYIASHNLNFFAGNIIKYITRHQYTKNFNDLKKVRHYIEKFIEVEMDGEQE